jgi:hypothetical protein
MTALIIAYVVSHAAAIISITTRQSHRAAPSRGHELSARHSIRVAGIQHVCIYTCHMLANMTWR